MERYKILFRSVGEEFLWASRLKMSKEELMKKLDEEYRHVYAVCRGGKDVGILELSFETLETDNSVEIVFFGVVPEEIGSGLSRVLMNRALELAWETPGTKRVCLLTCSFDHPGAVKFYKKHGFVPYKIGIEVKDDPRLLGVLPKTAAWQVVLIE